MTMTMSRKRQVQLLALVVVILVSTLLVLTIHYESQRWKLFCITLALFYISLYWCDSRSGLHPVLCRGLRYAAIVLGAFTSSFFFFFFLHGRLSPAGIMPPAVRVIGGALCFFVAGYYLHRLIVLPRDYYGGAHEEADEEAAGAGATPQQQPQGPELMFV